MIKWKNIFLFVFSVLFGYAVLRFLGFQIDVISFLLSYIFGGVMAILLEER